MSVFADGLFQYGGQPVGAVWASPWSVARFVDGENGSDAFDGLKPTQPFATIQAAVTASTRGDVIYVRPQQYTGGTGFSRYTEEVTVTAGASAGSATHFENADISIIGCVNTPNPEYGVRWKHATDTTGCCLINHAPALHLENLGFYAESALAAIELLNNGATTTQRGSDGTTIYNCVIKGAAIYVLSGGDGTIIQKCHLHTAYGGGTGGLGNIHYSCSANPGTRLKILDNIFYGGNVTEAPATAYITVLPPMTVMTIGRNFFGKIPTDGHYIDLSGSSNTGLVVNNTFADADIVLETDIHIGGCVQANNWDTAGIVV